MLTSGVQNEEKGRGGRGIGNGRGEEVGKRGWGEKLVILTWTKECEREPQRST